MCLIYGEEGYHHRNLWKISYNHKMKRIAVKKKLPNDQITHTKTKQKTIFVFMLLFHRLFFFPFLHQMKNNSRGKE